MEQWLIELFLSMFVMGGIAAIIFFVRWEFKTTAHQSLMERLIAMQEKSEAQTVSEHKEMLEEFKSNTKILNKLINILTRLEGKIDRQESKLDNHIQDAKLHGHD